MAKDSFSLIKDFVKSAVTRHFNEDEQERCRNFLRYGGTRLADEGWLVFAGFERRGYAVFLQRTKDEKEIRVCAGCRYFTLRQAMNHWGKRSRGQGGKAILQLIEVGLQRARWQGYVKSRHFPTYFDTKLRR